IDVTTGRTVQFVADEYGTGTSDVEHSLVEIGKLANDSIPVSFHLNEEPGKPEPQKATLPETWDLNSFLVALRAWQAPAGVSAELDVFRSRFLWKTKVTTKGKSKVETAQEDTPELPAVRFDAHLMK